MENINNAEKNQGIVKKKKDLKNLIIYFHDKFKQNFPHHTIVTKNDFRTNSRCISVFWREKHLFEQMISIVPQHSQNTFNNL